VLGTPPVGHLDLPLLQSLLLRGPQELERLLLILAVGLLLVLLNLQRLAAERRAESVSRELERVLDEQETVEVLATRLVTVAGELQTSVELYRRQFGSLAGTFRAERGGRIVECSDLFARLLGAASPAEITALSMRDLFHDRGEWSGLVAALVPGGAVSQELSWRRVDGAPLAVLANLRDAGGLVEGVAIDIADRARAERDDPPSVIVVDPSRLGADGEARARFERAVEAALGAPETLESTTRASKR
jgi:PAS domain-containing protein